MFTDFVINTGSGMEGRGEVGSLLADVRYDPSLMRPFIEDNPNSPLRGRACVTVNTGRKKFNEQSKLFENERKTFLISDLQERGINSPVFNATTLRKADWIMIDRAVVRATRPRLKAWNDLLNTSSYGGFDAMSKMTLEYEAMTDPGEAVVDMDGLSDARTDNPLFKLRSVPLPITHADFWFSARRIAVSRNSGTPLDTTMAEASGRRVAENIEQTLIGTNVGVTFGTQTTGYGTHDGTSRVFGYTNFTYRVTKTNLTTPDGTNPQAVLADLIAMRETMYSNGFYGPFILYTSTSYDQWLDNDYFRSGSTAVQRTLRERLQSIDGITAVRRLDYLTSGYQMILVQMTPDVIQAVDGMDVTTVQWESQGGMRVNFKIMAIQVPLLKAPYNGVAGIVHGTTS